ncbi:hypothetical protein ACQPYA_12270 [Micromonospora sp. CA-263727]|uniref:hypothetical protein n=1 Tax=Micromonospora sp. CA-263727 TaxID=3239967 RepID=UPI003D902704
MSISRVRAFVALAFAVAVIAATAAVTSPAQAYSSPAIWVGSPVDGTWGTYPYADTTPSGGHHTVFKASPRNDWSVDLPTGSGQAVVLYVAPSNSAYNNQVTTKVTQIIDNDACRYGGGGDLVTVGVYYNNTLYGHTSYTHLKRDPSLYVGKTVSRWGTTLGTVAHLSGAATGGSNCWTGPHVHMELRAQTQYACWNRTYTNFASLWRTNFVGFVSGPLTSAAVACP